MCLCKHTNPSLKYTSHTSVKQNQEETLHNILKSHLPLSIVQEKEPQPMASKSISSLSTERHHVSAAPVQTNRMLYALPKTLLLSRC